jgi:hypothetical protein
MYVILLKTDISILSELLCSEVLNVTSFMEAPISYLSFFFLLSVAVESYRLKYI